MVEQRDGEIGYLWAMRAGFDACAKCGRACSDEEIKYLWSF